MNISSTSMPAGILISALCRQVATGSLQDSIANVHAPTVSGTTSAFQRSTPSGCFTMRCGGRRLPLGSVRTTSALSAS